MNIHTTTYTEAEIWQLLEMVTDPEVPVLSILDLGIVRHVHLGETGRGQEVEITITPTYSGCPAMDMIAANIRMELMMAGIPAVKINYQLSPAWSTDWMTESGKEKLKAYGIAPPVALVRDQEAGGISEERGIPCPQCGSQNTELISHFGSTACKALHRCLDCKEPFDYFKCH